MTGESKLIVVEGLSLCVALRTARRNIAHGERSAEELSEILQLNSQQLQINKLRRINDVLLAGLSRFDAFDQYLNAFYAGGRKVNGNFYINKFNISRNQSAKSNFPSIPNTFAQLVQGVAQRTMESIHYWKRILSHSFSIASNQIQAPLRMPYTQLRQRSSRYIYFLIISFRSPATFPHLAFVPTSGWAFPEKIGFKNNG